MGGNQGKMRPGGWGRDGVSTLRGRGKPARLPPGLREKEGASAGQTRPSQGPDWRPPCSGASGLQDCETQSAVSQGPQWCLAGAQADQDWVGDGDVHLSTWLG